MAVEIDDTKIFESVGGVQKNSLVNIMSCINDDDNEYNILKKSPYMDIPSIKNHLEMNKGAFTILSTNIACLNAKFVEPCIFIQDLKQNGPFFSAICLQESWLSQDDDISMYQLDGYTCISEGRKCSPKGGLVIYLHENFTYSTVALYERSDVWEGQFIQISGNELLFKLLLGNVYKPPRDIPHNYNTFNDEFNHVLE